jgi:Protein of unknown function (DUF2752)
VLSTIRKYQALVFSHFELIVWISAIVVLYFMPQRPGPSLCVFKAFGLNRCPGCGIGHSIQDALHFQFSASWNHHPMGILAVLIIFIRIKQLLPIKKNKHAT